MIWCVAWLGLAYVDLADVAQEAVVTARGADESLVVEAREQAARLLLDEIEDLHHHTQGGTHTHRGRHTYTQQ